LIKSQFISGLNAKDDVLSPFLVKYIATAEGKDGKTYLNVVLADNSGEIEARKWQGAELAMQRISAGDIVIVSGKVNAFQGRIQLIIQDMSVLAEAQVKREDYIQKAGTAPEKMFNDLMNIVNSLEEVYIRDLLLSVLNDFEISRRLKIWQAGKSIHHAYQSGLLEHILSCTNIANTLSVHYKVNRSYVIAGCILHDLCKIYELSEGPVVEYTEEGKLIGHLVKGLEIVDFHAAKIKNFPYSIKTHIKHILLSHHGEYEYGSPKVPSTSEAYLVHLIDYMDSKMSSLEQVKKSDSSTTNWSGFVKHLDRIVYKSDLPSFTHYLKDDAESEKDKKPATQEKLNKDTKTTMGNLLKNFKVDE
jgi:3'-5' exoribonuclease